MCVDLLAFNACDTSRSMYCSHTCISSSRAWTSATPAALCIGCVTSLWFFVRFLCDAAAAQTLGARFTVSLLIVSPLVAETADCLQDLKPQNLLVDRKGTLKLADFGLARAFMIPVRSYTHEVVTLWYRAPEILLGQRTYAPAVDMWSIGTIFVEMVNRKPLWPGDSEIDELFRIFKCVCRNPLHRVRWPAGSHPPVSKPCRGKVCCAFTPPARRHPTSSLPLNLRTRCCRSLGTPDEEVWPGVTSLPDYSPTFPHWPKRDMASAVPTLDPLGVDLLNKMLQYQPSKRISARAAMAHPWFDTLDKSSL